MFRHTSITETDTEPEISKKEKKLGCTPSPPVNHSPIIPVKNLPKALFTFPVFHVFTRVVEAMLY